MLCTFTDIVHVPTAKEGLEKPIVPEPAAAVTVPPQVFTMLGVEATTRLPGTAPVIVGKLSAKLASMGITFPLVTLKVRVLTFVPGLPATLAWIAAGLKLLLMEGGCKMMIPAFTVPPPVAVARLLALVV